MVNGMVEAKVEYCHTKPAATVYDAWLTSESVRVWMQASLRSMGLPGDVRSVEIDAPSGWQIPMVRHARGGRGLSLGKLS